ncbi:unnamed protein product, partial [Musa acuminata subsp. burmannicoides]
RHFNWCRYASVFSRAITADLLAAAGGRVPTIPHVHGGSCCVLASATASPAAVSPPARLDLVPRFPHRWPPGIPRVRARQETGGHRRREGRRLPLDGVEEGVPRPVRVVPVVPKRRPRRHVLRIRGGVAAPSPDLLLRGARCVNSPPPFSF